MIKVEVMELYLREIAKELSLPALLLDLDAFDENCKQIANKANGKTIRVATKSIRSIPVLKRIFQMSPLFKGVMCYSPQEAIFLAKQGFDDILIGYPAWDDSAHREIAKLTEQGCKISLMVDSIEQVEHLSNIAEKEKGYFRLCIDTDMSTSFGKLHFGVRRSPLKTAEDAVRLARKIKETPRVKLIGVMGYEAQIAGVGDRLPNQTMKNLAITYMKKRSIRPIKQRRKKIIQSLEKEGFRLELVNGGGTGSLSTTTKEKAVTEVTAGSGFYAPLLFDYYRDFRYSPALFFALPVVRKPAPKIYTCLGGGYVSSGPHGADKVPQPVYPPNGKLLPHEGAGEVQTPIFYEKETLEIGDAIIFRAAKAGEICERFNEMICISDGKIVDRFLTYRGEGKCFL